MSALTGSNHRCRVQFKCAQTVIGQRSAGNGPNCLSYDYYYYYYYYSHTFSVNLILLVSAPYNTSFINATRTNPPCISKSSKPNALCPPLLYSPHLSQCPMPTLCLCPTLVLFTTFITIPVIRIATILMLQLSVYNRMQN